MKKFLIIMLCAALMLSMTSCTITFSTDSTTTTAAAAESTTTAAAESTTTAAEESTTAAETTTVPETTTAAETTTVPETTTAAEETTTKAEETTTEEYKGEDVTAWFAENYNGTWSSDDARFLATYSAGGQQYLAWGIWDDSYIEGGRIDKVYKTADRSYTVVIDSGKEYYIYQNYDVSIDAYAYDINKRNYGYDPMYQYPSSDIWAGGEKETLEGMLYGKTFVNNDNEQYVHFEETSSGDIEVEFGAANFSIETHLTRITNIVKVGTATYQIFLHTIPFGPQVDMDLSFYLYTYLHNRSKIYVSNGTFGMYGVFYSY